LKILGAYWFRSKKGCDWLHAAEACLAALSIVCKRLNANNVDSTENIDRLLAQAADIMSNPDAFVPAEVADEAMV
jgi:hypothetical protein